MDCTAEFEGSILINGEPEGDGVYVFLTEETLVLAIAGEHFRRTKIHVSPFNKFMVFKQDPRRMKDGFFYEVKGTQVGGISVGPLGHPGDGEFDFRPMTFFRLEVTYFRDSIRVNLAGDTAPGVSGFDSAKVLAPWKFYAEFKIPKDRLQEFFKLTDFVNDNVFKLFDDVFGTA